MIGAPAYPVALRAALLGAALGLSLPGCAPFRPGLPSEPAPSVAGAVAHGTGPLLARAAMSQVGVPYRYGGAEPSRGFDCSGLVWYVHGQEGIAVPRTAAAQYAAARKVAAGELRPGDLVFFRLAPRSNDVTHVGIYTGQGRFVHAPQAGRSVSESPLDDAYYRERFAGSGRFYEDSARIGPRGAAAPR
jgi:cell wall-associated NlpC family hydrolase